MRRNAVIGLCLAGCLVVAMMGSAEAKSPAKAGTTKATTCVSAAEYLNSTSKLTLAAPLAGLLPTDFAGTVFVPTDAALNAVIASILQAASGIANKNITAVPTGVNLLALEELKDVLKLHVLTSFAVDPSVLTADMFDGNTKLTLNSTILGDTLLSAVKKQSLCPNTTKAPLSAVIEATLKPKFEVVSATIVAAGSNASVANISVGSPLCKGSQIHIIDAVLLPCKTSNSVIPTLAKTLAAASGPVPSPSPSANTTSNGTSNSTTKGNSSSIMSMSVGTMVAALCAVMIMSGTTSYILIAVVTILGGGLVMVATI